MKKLVQRSLLSGLLTCWLLACNKETSNSSLKSGTSVQTLTLSTLSVKQGQPLQAALPAGIVITSVRWSVSPDSTAHIKVDSGHATLFFRHGGLYRILANYSTGADTTKRDSCYGTITVSDTVYTPPPPYKAYDTLAIVGDSVYITPMLDTTHGLVLSAHSARRYGCSPYYLYQTATGTGSGVFVGFDAVVVADSISCGSFQFPARSDISIASGVNGLANGTYPLSVSFSGTTYNGSLTITATDYTFTWNDSTRVFISPKRVIR